MGLFTTTTVVYIRLGSGRTKAKMSPTITESLILTACLRNDHVWNQMKQRKYKNGILLLEDALMTVSTRPNQSVSLKGDESTDVSNNVQLIALVRIPGEEGLEEY